MNPLYSIEIRHEGLGKHRVITGSNREIVQSKARAQVADWNAKYSVIKSKLDARREVDDKVAQSANETEKAKQAFEQLRTLLSAVLDAKHEIDWESLKESAVFLNDRPAGPVLLNYPREPKPDDIDIRAELGFLDKIFGARAKKKKAAAAASVVSPY
jgi:restriction system protein